MREAFLDDRGRKAVHAATLVGGLLIAQQVAGRATRDALFLSAFHVSSLPVVMMASSVLSILAVLALSRALSRRSPFEVVPAAAGLGSLLLLLEWALSLAAPRLAAVAVYLHMALFGATLVSGSWSLVNERFDPYTAKRVVGRIGLGASAGGVGGGLLAWLASRLIPVPAMLLVMAVLSLGAVAGMRQLGQGHAAAAGPSLASAASPAPSALRTLRGVPYLRALALVVALGALTESLLDYVLKAQAAATFSRGAQLMSFFAILNGSLALLGLLAQSALARPSLRVLGLAGTVAVRPAMVLVAALLGLMDPRMWSAVLARALQEVNSNSLFRSGYELLYTPLPEAEKRPTKSVVDVGFDKLGSLLGGAVVLLAVALAPSGSLRLLFALGAGLCLTALALTGRLHRGYVGTLQQSLRAGKVRLDISEVPDEATRLTLAQTNMALDRETLLREIEAMRAQGATAAGEPGVASGARAPRDRESAEDPVLRAIADLRSGQPERARRALRESTEPDPVLVSHLIPLLARDDVFLEVLRALRRVAPAATGQLLDALLDPRQDPAVRRRLPRVLKVCATRRAVDGLVLGLEAEVFEVRARCALALAGITGRNPGLVMPREAVFAAILRELKEGGAGPQPILEHVFTLLSLVLEREPLQIAFWAMRGSDPALRGTALEYLENVLPQDLREALWPRLGECAPAPRPMRPAQEVVQDLLRSSAALPLSREALRARLRLTPRTPGSTPRR